MPQTEISTPAKTLFIKGVDVLALLQEDQDEAGGEVKVTEIRVRKSDSGPQEKK